MESEADFLSEENCHILNVCVIVLFAVHFFSTKFRHFKNSAIKCRCNKGVFVQIHRRMWQRKKLLFVKSILFRIKVSLLSKVEMYI